MTHGTSQPQPQPTPGAQPWEPGIIARYLTVGGATVDISHDVLYLHDTEPNVTVARCGGEGCEKFLTEKWPPHAYRLNDGSSGADAEARAWAQSHAETCRAMPRPVVDQ